MAHPTPFRRWFNLRKTDWNGNSTELDKLSEDVEPIIESKHMYEEYRKPYVCDPFDNYTIETGNAIMKNMKEQKKRWEVIKSINMIHNSRKARKTIRNISNDPTSSTSPYPESANQVSHQLLVKGRGSMFTKPKRPVEDQKNPRHTCYSTHWISILRSTI